MKISTSVLLRGNIYDKNQISAYLSHLTTPINSGQWFFSIQSLSFCFAQTETDQIYVTSNLSTAYTRSITGEIKEETPLHLFCVKTEPNIPFAVNFPQKYTPITNVDTQIVLKFYRVTDKTPFMSQTRFADDPENPRCAAVVNFAHT